MTASLFCLFDYIYSECEKRKDKPQRLQIFFIYDPAKLLKRTKNFFDSGIVVHRDLQYVELLSFTY